MKFSIIVPVYNVENYLETCIESLLPCVQAEDELFLVQGPSQDRSRQMSENYAARFSTVRLLEQDGKGLSNARNCGLRAAAGDYVLFIDSDDFVDSDALNTLLDKVRQESAPVDVWMTDYYKYFEGSGQVCLVRQIGTRDLRSAEQLAQALPRHQSFWNVWRNLYRRAFLLENGLFFQENTHAEDGEHITRVLLSDPKIRTVDTPFYQYRIGRTGSLMNSVSIDRIQETVSVLKTSIQRLRKSGYAWGTVPIIGFQFEYLLNMVLVRELPPEKRAEGAEIFEDYRSVLLPTADRLVRIVTAVLQIVGVQRLAWMLRCAKTWKRRMEHREI